MKTVRRRMLGICLGLWATTGCGAADPKIAEQQGPDRGQQPSGEPITKTYQQSVSGYMGTRSVGISTYGGLGMPGQYNENGSTFADGSNDWCMGTDIPPTPYSEVYLLRFDDLGIPAQAKVQSAQLMLHVYGNDTNSQLFVDGRYLAAPWNADVPQSCAGCSNSPVGWRFRDGSSARWSLAGASGPDDTIADRTFRLPTSGFVALGHEPKPYTADLDPEVVQRWLQGMNYGVRITAGVAGVHMGLVQAQRDITGSRPLSMRPQLSITYVN